MASIEERPPAPKGHRRGRRPLAWAALVLLILALPSAWMAWQARQQQATMTGPVQLVALPSGDLWFLMQGELWCLGPDGKLKARLNARQVQLPALPDLWAVQNTVQADGPHSIRLVALLPGSGDLHVLDPSTGRLLQRIALQWPRDLPSSKSRPAGLAMHPDGRVAITLAEAGVVAIFDADGHLLARSATGSLAPTRAADQGLWWDDQTLWAVDTERHALVQFKGSDLSVRSRLDLPRIGLKARWTTQALAHPRAGMERIAPVATLIRLQDDLATGRVSHVWLDGLEKDEQLAPDARPAGMTWAGETLIISDAGQLRLRRFNIDRQPLADLGDASVGQALQRLRQERDHWIQDMLTWMAITLACVLVSGALVAWALRRPPTTAASSGPFLGVSPALSQAFALSQAWDRSRQDQESLREIFEMQRGRNRRWVVLTNRRLVSLVPDAPGPGWRLERDWHRSDIATVEQLARASMTRRQRREAPAHGDGAWLCLKTRDGQSLEGFVQPRATADRIQAIVSLTARRVAPSSGSQG